jgi:serine-type D-Ala-D-Ala carboxypeptidase/endopeptidase
LRSGSEAGSCAPADERLPRGTSCTPSQGRLSPAAGRATGQPAAVPETASRKTAQAGRRRGAGTRGRWHSWLLMTWSEDAARTLAETFDGTFAAPGVVTAAACIDEAGTAIQASPGDMPADGRFEIGSITKTMTATLLALLEADGTLGLDDEVSRWLSAGPNSGITLRQLATHTSGLPRLAPNHGKVRADQANPYAQFGPRQAEIGLRQAVLAPGRPYQYSNFGYQLLGLALERASGLPYQQLISQRLLEPLVMTCSGTGASGGGTPLPGHGNGGEVPHWDQPLPGAGGVEATIGDMARYARACLHPPRGPLGAAITAAQAPRAPLGNGTRQALAWVAREDGIRLHTGGTGGFTSAILIDPGRARAVVMLASSGGGWPLAHAAFLALSGGDPRAARPQPPGPEWDARAREAIQMLLDGQATDVHARTTANFQGQVSPGQISQGWREETRGLGPATEVQVTSRRCQPPASSPTSPSRSPAARAKARSTSTRQARSQASGSSHPRKTCPRCPAKPPAGNLRRRPRQGGADLRPRRPRGRPGVALLLRRGIPGGPHGAVLARPHPARRVRRRLRRARLLGVLSRQ